MDAALAQLRIAGAPTAGRGTRRKLEDGQGKKPPGPQTDFTNDVTIKILMSHDAALRQLLGWAEDAFKMPKDSPLSPLLLGAVAEWKGVKPPSGPHPLGGVQNAIMGTFIKFASAFAFGEDNGHLCEKQSQLSSLANDITSKNGLQGLASHFNSAHVKETKKGGEVVFKFLVCLRSPFRQYYDLFENVLASQSAARLDGAAPKGPLIRELGNHMTG